VLEPDDRRLLLESLRPPIGYELDHALGTTFTLDLLALLTAPMAFTLFDSEGEDGGPPTDPVTLLRAIREYGDRMTIFCQGGQIAVPPHDQLLFANLEDSVYQVNLRGPLFHPKVWLLRFVAPDLPVRYRLLCLSRNLTFDRSWDTVLRLDGELTSRKNAFKSNHPLGDFFAALPEMRLKPRLPAKRLELLSRMEHEVRRVAFETPAGFDPGIDYWPRGIEGYKKVWPFQGDIRRMLVISPFIGAKALADLAASGEEHVLVSRAESLDRLPDREVVLRPFDVRQMNPATEFDIPLDDDANTDRPKEAETLRGLHAKVYAADRGHARGSIWVGSANATGAGLGRNVELLIELHGTQWHCGVDAVLDGKANGGDSFGSLLTSYDLDAEPTLPDPALEKLEENVEALRRDFADQRLILSVEGPTEGGEYSLELIGPKPGWPKLARGVKVSAWPITRNPGEAKTRLKPAPSQVLARFEAMTATALTPFMGFEIEATAGKLSHSVRFALHLPLRGAPRGRREDILRALLNDRERILRYLLLVLAETGGAAALAPDVIEALAAPTIGEAGARGTMDLPLLEGLLRALDGDQAKLEQIDRLLADLEQTGAVSDLLPEGFREVWDPIWAARTKAPR
jgi:hypothetical protein